MFEMRPRSRQAWKKTRNNSPMVRLSNVLNNGSFTRLHKFYFVGEFPSDRSGAASHDARFEIPLTLRRSCSTSSPPVIFQSSSHP